MESSFLTAITLVGLPGSRRKAGKVWRNTARISSIWLAMRRASISLALLKTVKCALRTSTQRSEQMALGDMKKRHNGRQRRENPDFGAIMMRSIFVTLMELQGTFFAVVRKLVIR